MITPLRKRFKITDLEKKTLTWWKTRRPKIDVDPPYQRRGRLWADTDKAYLVDSILNGFDIPKVYVADFTWGDSELNKQKLPYAIIDGKQRMEAIFDFFDGKVVLNDDFVYLPNPQLSLAGLGYQDLQKNYPEIAEEFDNFNLHVVSVFAQDEEPINELFVRLNRSKPLTGAEVRNAMTGPAPEVIRQIAKHEFFLDLLSFKIERGQDLNAAGKLLLCEYNGELSETKKSTLDDFVKQMKDKPTDRLELAGRRVVDVLDEMTEIFLPKDSLLNSAGIITVYYWLVREVSSKFYVRVRKFLVEFERARKQNKALISDEPKSSEIDQELIQYDNFNRSTNDQSSHEGRFRTLQTRLERFLKAP
jgi:hypothetical protein